MATKIKLILRWHASEVKARYPSLTLSQAKQVLDLMRNNLDRIDTECDAILSDCVEELLAKEY